MLAGGLAQPRWPPFWSLGDAIAHRESIGVFGKVGPRLVAVASLPGVVPSVPIREFTIVRNPSVFVCWNAGRVELTS